MSLLIKDKKFSKAHPKLRPIAVVKGGKHDKKLILFNEDPEAGYESLSLEGDKGKFQALPDFSRNEKLYVTGNSGAGKSYYIKKWLQEWQKRDKENKDKPIYIFSSLTEDETLDDLPNIERIPIDESLISDPITLESLADSFVLMDDTATISNPILRKIVLNIQDHLLQTSRHANITMACTSHILSNYNKTRLTLQESTSITFFVRASGVFHIRKYLESQAGLSKDQIKRVLKQKSRWITLNKQYQSFIISEKEIFMLNTDD